MKKILIIGNADSVWVKRYIEYVLPREEFRVALLSPGGNRQFADFYKEKQVKILDVFHNEIPVLCKIPKVRGLAKIWADIQTARRSGPFDVVHVHYVDIYGLMLGRALVRDGGRLVLSYWGSDLLRRDKGALGRMRRYVAAADAVTMGTVQLREKFVEAYGHGFDDKIHAARFGVSGFGNIDDARQRLSKADCKHRFGLAADKIVVAIGYNRSEGQQHDKVLACIGRLPRALQERIQIVLQCSYGDCGEEYWRAVKMEMDRLACQTVVLDEFYDEDTLAQLRLAVDIFINAQITDAFSASMQEYIYAGAMAVNPVWLPYDELKEYGIDYLQYADFEELPAVLTELLENGVEPGKDNIRLARYTSWDGVKEGWLQCY